MLYFLLGCSQRTKFSEFCREVEHQEVLFLMLYPKKSEFECFKLDAA